MIPEIITELPQDIFLKIQPLMDSLEKFAISHVGHGIIADGFVPTATYSHPEWAYKYLAEKLHKIDPLRRYAINTPFQIIPWEDLAIECKEELYTLENRKKTCSVKNGVLISLKNNKFHETFVFGSDYHRFNFCDIYLSNKEEIDHIMKEISYLHRTFSHQTCCVSKG